ncbi:MAG: hypothetical protein HYZ45_06060 [Burkholderiales bacterium]|nr:hypothetical protein [Burkholderiales bacterium]
MPGATNQAQQTCWREARAAKNHCYRQVQKRYQQDSSLQKAKRLAQANATKAAAQTSAQ